MPPLLPQGGGQGGEERRGGGRAVESRSYSTSQVRDLAAHHLSFTPRGGLVVEGATVAMHAGNFKCFLRLVN